MAEIIHFTDKQPIRQFLNQDRALTAYALGDLDDAFWPESDFYGTRQNGTITAILLLYRGLDPCVVAGFGDPAGVAEIMGKIHLPSEIYYLFLPEMRSALEAHYDLAHGTQEWRMVLNPAEFAAPDLGCVSRLGPEHADVLAGLFKHAAEPGEEIVAFTPWQIAHGVFYGVWDGDTLIASAGTHVWSETESVAAIGNVFTRPDYRGRGYAQACTGAVAAEAIRAQLDTIILNVRHDNTPAIHVYEKLGFRRYHLFLEGPGLRLQ
jgi:ribosomal protein S18 acetylase RimI-like enzyme